MSILSFLGGVGSNLINGAATSLGGSIINSLTGSSSNSVNYVDDTNNIMGDPNFVDNSTTFDDLVSKYGREKATKMLLLKKVTGSYSSNSVPESVYYSQLMNMYNQQSAKDMLALQNQYNTENYEKYMSPQALASQYLSAGLNPALVMSGNSAGSVSSASQQSPSGSIDGSSIAAGASNYAANASASASRFGSVVDAAANANLRSASSHRANAEARGVDIDNLTKNVENLERIRELKARATTQEEKADLARIEKEILANTQVEQENTIRHREASAYNELILQGDQHAINQYEKTSRYYLSQIAQKNYEWLDSEKSALLANIYAQSRMYGATASQAINQAIKTLEETKGVKLSNDQRSQLNNDFITAQRDQYKAIKVALHHAEVELEKAKYEKDHQSITYWNSQIKTLTESFKNVSVGVSSFIPKP